MKRIDAFRESLSRARPPEGLDGLLLALWWEAKGDWDKAHKIAQDIPGADAAWVHAYLHRKEGDEGNAGYWYSQAGRPGSRQTPEQEWEQITESLLKYTEK